MNSTFIYILVSFIVVYLIRALPLTLIKKPITNRYIRSFLYYVPYVTLAVMTFPAITQATASPLAGLCAFVVGIFCAWNNKGLPFVAGACCITVLLVEFFTAGL